MAVCALRNRFLGGTLGPSAKYPAYRARMFRREAYRHDESRAVHEGIEPRERPIVLEGDLEHELAATLNEAFGDTWRYARLESLHVARPATLSAALIGIVLRPFAKFGYRTLVDGGWRDGWRGMLKISLDAGTDALVWVLSLRRGRRGEATGAGDGTQTGTDAAANREGHFGRRPVGPPKVVAMSGGAATSRAAASWLAGLRAQGIDVALLTTATGAVTEVQAGTEDRAPADPGRRDAGRAQAMRADAEIPLRPVARLWPLSAIRALEIETQLRTIDAVVSVGRRARLVGRLVPGTLRPEIAGLDANLDPRAAAELVRASLGRD